MPTKIAYTEVEVEISLDDFTDDELMDEMEERGLDIKGEFDSIYHLVICGQIKEAKAEALLIVERIIGRPFK